jgi:hypothetical protein
MAGRGRKPKHEKAIRSLAKTAGPSTEQARRILAEEQTGASHEPTEKVKDYRHGERRPNSPPAGLATYDHTLPSRKIYDYDPHLDPQLVWAGKKEHPSFDVENVALHIHERISTAAIVKAVQREPLQRDLFADPQFPLTQQIEFYQHLRSKHRRASSIAGSRCRGLVPRPGLGRLHVLHLAGVFPVKRRRLGKAGVKAK